jgi:hypothetical protein
MTTTSKGKNKYDVMLMIKECETDKICQPDETELITPGRNHHQIFKLL